MEGKSGEPDYLLTHVIKQRGNREISFCKSRERQFRVFSDKSPPSVFLAVLICFSRLATCYLLACASTS